MKKIILSALIVLVTISPVSARGYHYSSRVYYGGGHHTYSHGGHYYGGFGSSHRGGHYHNQRTGNHYGRHK